MSLTSTVSAPHPYNFPFPPYTPQLKYMSVLSSCLSSPSPSHALLESPTGTGKTLMLLSVCTAGSSDPRKRSAPVVYTARTHSQLRQVMKEYLKVPAFRR